MRWMSVPAYVTCILAFLVGLAECVTPLLYGVGEIAPEPDYHLSTWLLVIGIAMFHFTKEEANE